MRKFLGKFREQVGDVQGGKGVDGEQTWIRLFLETTQGLQRVLLKGKFLLEAAGGRTFIIVVSRISKARTGQAEL